MSNNIKPPLKTGQTFFLSEIIGAKVIWNGKRIGRLVDMIIIETEKIPEVTTFFIRRPFGYHSLLVPWEKVKESTKNQIIIDIENLEPYEKDPAEHQILLKDHVLDKKVLDLDDNEVEVVYDVRLFISGNKMYVSDVDFSKYGLLRRIGFKWLANFIYNLANIIKEETLSWNYIQPLPENLSSFKGNVKLKILKEKLSDIHPVDLADMLEELDHEHRLAIFNQLDTEQASDTLEEVEPRVQRDLISSIDIRRVAELINDMTPAQAADVLSILPAADADNIILHMDKDVVEKIQFLIDKHDEKIINFATPHVLKFSPQTQVKQVLDDFRHIAKDKDVVMYIYVVDDQEKLIGVVDVKELLQADMEEKLENIMITHVISLKPENTLRETASMFYRYSFRAIPLTDHEEKLIGVIPYRDIINLKHHFI
ncbi:MAG: CBS domain-containing protein [Candidatus Margulisbacteria bacterium]|nr:CBS domain-containing protein [Candidatus Margulisiibacteriota bacterium]